MLQSQIVQQIARYLYRSTSKIKPMLTDISNYKYHYLPIKHNRILDTFIAYNWRDLWSINQMIRFTVTATRVILGLILKLFLSFGNLETGEAFASMCQLKKFVQSVRQLVGWLVSHIYAAPSGKHGDTWFCKKFPFTKLFIQVANYDWSAAQVWTMVQSQIISRSSSSK